MSLKDFFSQARALARGPKPSLFNAVIDTSDDTLVAIENYPAALLFLSESMMDTIYIADIVATNEIQLIKKSHPSTYPEWSWDHHSRTFKKTNGAIITESMRERAFFATKKAEGFSRAIYLINYLRKKIGTSLLFQEGIYAEKERQAQLFKDANFDAGLLSAAPYVVQYAEGAGIPLRQAAEEILLQAQLDHEYLAKTEKVRLALFTKIRSAKRPEEIEEVLTTYTKTGIV